MDSEFDGRERQDVIHLENSCRESGRFCVIQYKIQSKDVEGEKKNQITSKPKIFILRANLFISCFVFLLCINNCNTD